MALWALDSTLGQTVVGSHAPVHSTRESAQLNQPDADPHDDARLPTNCCCDARLPCHAACVSPPKARACPALLAAGGKEAGPAATPQLPTHHHSQPSAHKPSHAPDSSPGCPHVRPLHCPDQWRHSNAPLPLTRLSGCSAATRHLTTPWQRRRLPWPLTA